MQTVKREEVCFKKFSTLTRFILLPPPQTKPKTELYKVFSENIQQKKKKFIGEEKKKREKAIII
jgi:hypothetical protein